jgi:hypothetical protein
MAGGAAAAAGATGWTPPGAGGRASMEMPNIQALGLSNSQGGQGSGNNPLGMGMNMGALPMNPALVAAALNWNLIGNLQGGHGTSGPGSEHPPFPTPTSFSTPGGNVTTTQGHNSMTSGGGAGGGILTGWGANGPGAPDGGIPAATPPGTMTPQHHPVAAGSWPSQGKRDSHAGSGGGAGPGGGGGGGGGGSWKSYGDMN